jgi:conserved oligomeric Golgi complex subunit 3
MVLDVPSLPSSSSSTSSSPSSDNEEEDNNELTVEFNKLPEKSLGKLHISHLLEMVLQDAPTGLFFKAQSVIQSDIQYYTPKGEDLAYLNNSSVSSI